MADPDPYERLYSFNDFQTANPRTSLPGDRLDVELDRVGQITEALVAAIGDIRRADGQIHNYKVTFDALHPKVRAAVLGQGYDPAWVGPLYDLGLGPDDEDAPLQLQIRGMSREDLAQYVGHERQIVVNTDDWIIRIMDGETPGGRAPSTVEPGDGAPITFFQAEYVATGNVRTYQVLTDDNIALGREWNVDGFPVDDGTVVLLTGQLNPVENGLWAYSKGTNTLVRADDPPVGSRLLRPVEVEIQSGMVYEGVNWEIISPYDGIVGTDAFVFQDAALGVGRVPSTMVLAGPAFPNRAPLQARPRRLQQGDMPTRRESTGIIRYELSRPALVGLKTRYVSQIVDSALQMDRRSAINTFLDEAPTLVFDEPVQLNGQLDNVNLSNRTLVFYGQNCPIIQRNPAASVFDLSGVYNLTFRGDCCIDYIFRANAGVRAVKTTGATERLVIDSLRTSGIDYAFFALGATFPGRGRIDNISVKDYATEKPIRVNVNAKDFDVGTLNGYLLSGVDTQIVNHSIIWGEVPSILSLTGTITADRTLTISAINAFEGKTFRITNNSATAFSWVVKNDAGTTLATIANGATVKARATNGDWVLDT